MCFKWALSCAQTQPYGCGLCICIAHTGLRAGVSKKLWSVAWIQLTKCLWWELEASWLSVWHFWHFCLLCTSLPYFFLIFSFIFVIVLCLNFSHSTFGHWIRREWWACSPSLEKFCHLILRSFPSGLYFKPLWEDEKIKIIYQQFPQSHGSIKTCGRWPEFMLWFSPADHWSTKYGGKFAQQKPE